LPFDNVICRTVGFDPTDWHSQVDAKKKIADQARHALAQGFAISNPVTQARGWKKLKESGDPQQAMIANLVEDVAVLKRELLRDRKLNLSPGEFHLLNLSREQAVLPGDPEVYLPPKISSQLREKM
jgi:hypothetical protein